MDAFLPCDAFVQNRCEFVERTARRFRRRAGAERREQLRGEPCRHCFDIVPLTAAGPDDDCAVKKLGGIDQPIKFTEKRLRWQLFA
jgi:hypothetical protein